MISSATSSERPSVSTNRPQVGKESSQNENEGRRSTEQDQGRIRDYQLKDEALTCRLSAVAILAALWMGTVPMARAESYEDLICAYMDECLVLAPSPCVFTLTCSAVPRSVFTNTSIRFIEGVAMGTRSLV